MKKIIVLVLVLAATYVFAGKQVVTPSVLLLNSDKIELVSAEFIWGADPSGNICRITYKVHNNNRTEMVREVVYDISDADFTTLVSGFGGTMETRLEADIWNDIQSRFELVP